MFRMVGTYVIAKRIRDDVNVTVVTLLDDIIVKKLGYLSKNSPIPVFPSNHKAMCSNIVQLLCCCNRDVPPVAGNLPRKQICVASCYRDGNE